ncbi:UNVERIFIED_CONTAM: hypothetical protein Sangu_2800500 [Sesamum angustifolium]|uniref:Uncharacterized protein n=1 Tax=Sesamum angustifolium TaxID=2727405 RepID=A0AAW2IS77_9LAMI
MMRHKEFIYLIMISIDILFYGVYRQMELGNTLLEPEDTSLYGFARDWVHPIG